MNNIIHIISLLQDNFKIAVEAIKTNKLRTILTVSIIALGIMSLVGILTAISAIENGLKDQFMKLGTNSFKITNKNIAFHRHRRTGEARILEPIKLEEAKKFVKIYKYPALKTIYFTATATATAKYKSKKTNPNITVIGILGPYLKITGNKIKSGRNFSKEKINGSQNIVIIGHKLKEKLFGSKQAVNQYIKIGDVNYKIIGIMKNKGSSMIDKTDNSCILPMATAQKYYYKPNLSYEILIQPTNIKKLDKAIDAAIIAMRKAKHLSPKEKNNFEITKSDQLVRNLMDNLKIITLSTSIIGLITLLGAAIGLMNIMLVSVTERTKEIGIRKAVGATPSVIRQQFLFESVFIGQIGGILGIILGILAGNIVSLIIGSKFYVPYLWILAGFVLTFIVGIISGLAPAAKAAKLDPIKALHYE